MADISVNITTSSIVVAEMNRGYSGISGFSGRSGFSGANPGASGVSGTSGKSGTSGRSGFSGASGAGTSGTSGRSGYSGVSGTSGISGTSGKSGTSGVSGTSGLSGTSGVSGFSGGAAAFSSWTPTWTNLSVGDGTVVAKYTQDGKIVTCRVSLVFGSTTSVSGDITFSLPVTSVSYPGTATTQAMGEAQAFDFGNAGYIGQVVWASTTTAKFRFGNASATYLTTATPSGSVPFSWGNTDELWGYFSYEAA